MTTAKMIPDGSMRNATTMFSYEIARNKTSSPHGTEFLESN